MADAPGSGYLPARVVGNLWSYNVLRRSGVAGTNFAWNAVGQAFFVPTVVTHPTTVYGFLWANGSGWSAATSVDCGIYRHLTRLTSTGGVAQANAGKQYATCANVTLLPGVYYLGIAVSAITANAMFGFVGSTNGSATGVASVDFALNAFESGMFRMSAGGYPLPATATATQLAASQRHLPLFAAVTQGNVSM